MVGLDSGGGGERITAADALGFVRRHGRLALAGAVLAGVVTLGVLTFLLPPIYRSTATLVVLPPGFSSELDPDVLTVQGYQQLLESDAVLAETERLLAANEQFDGPRRLRLGDEVLSQIFVSRRQDTTSLSPMLEVVGRAESAAAATMIANTWSDAFMELVQELATVATSSSVSFLESQYPRTRAELEQLEEELSRRETGFRDRYDRLADQWGGRLAAFEQETADLVAAHNAETRTAMDAFTRRQLEPAGSAALSGEIVAKVLQLAAVRTQLAQTLPVVSLERGVTEDALWQALLERPMVSARVVAQTPNQPEQTWQPPAETWRPAIAPISAPSELLGNVASLTTEERNPVHGQLLLDATELESKLWTLAGGAVPRLAEIAGNLEKWQGERAAGFTKLLMGRGQKRGRLKRAASAELEAVARERTLMIDQLSRQVAQLHLLDDQLAKSYNEAVLAKSQEQQHLETVHLAAPAVARDNPEPRRRVLKTLLAAVLGGLAGLLVSIAREAAGSLAAAPAVSSSRHPAR